MAQEMKDVVGNITKILDDARTEITDTVGDFSNQCRVVDKTRDSTTSKICPFLLTLIAHVESGQILLFVESLVLSTTIY